MNKRRVLLWMVLTLTACSAIALAMAGNTVYYHDQVLTQAAQQFNGRTYVPLADVARVLGGRVASHSGGFEIVTGGDAAPGADASRTAAGGANEVRGASGKVGDWFFNGYWRFRANRVEHTDKYQYQYSASSGSDTPDGDRDELVVVHCTIKNGQKNADQPILTIHGPGVTALTDNQGQSYKPSNYDVRGTSLVPGAAENFAVCFSIPKGTVLKDMIFTIVSYGAATHATNVRVSLADM